MRDTNLRSRILVGFALFSVVQFFMMLAIAIYSYHFGEDNSLSQLVQSESNLLEFSSLDRFPPSLPARIKGLPPGVHELSGNDESELSGKELHAFIRQENGVTQYRVLQFTEKDNWIEQLKVYLLFAGIASLLLLGFGGWAGKVIAERVSNPMETLALKLARQGSHEHSVKFSDETLSGETALVANSLDSAFERIDQTRQREQTLSRNISHELRTPLTVIQTALDAGARDQQPSAQALRSARRACDEMELLTGACLELAREETSQENPQAIVACTNVANATKQIIRESLHLLDGKQVELDLTVEQQEINLEASEALVRLVIGNVIRNAFIHCSAGQIRINLTSGKLIVTNQSVNVEGLPQQRNTGFGMGLSILGQACERLGWEFELQQSARQQNEESTVVSTVSFANI